MNWIDLHTHTTASDGSLTPAELVAEAKRLGLKAVAITDHDNTDGLAAGHAAGRAAGVEVVPGIELSVERREVGSLHILGYWIDPENAELQSTLAPLKDSRAERNTRIVAKLAELGAPIALERVLEIAGGDVVGRPHIARALLEAGHVQSTQEAFDRFLARGKPAYLDRERLQPAEAVALLHRAGGLAVLAHPGDYKTPPEVIEAEIRALCAVGLDGLEVYYPVHTKAQTQAFEALARTLGLAMTGGSDFHGVSKPNNPLGKPPVPAELLGSLRARRPG